MPIWAILALGLGGLFVLKKMGGNGNAAQFYAGQSINIAATEVYSDSGLTQDAGSYPGGSGTVQATDLNNNTVSFLGPTGTGIGGGQAGWVKASAVSAA